MTTRIISHDYVPTRRNSRDTRAIQPLNDHVFAGGADGDTLVRDSGTDEGAIWRAGGAGAGYDVRTYGAVGDGLTDDTVALQAALTACRVAGGGTVYLPPGTYLVAPTATVWLGVGSNTTVCGDGPATIVKVKNNAGDYKQLFGAYPTVATAISNLTFRDFRIDQNPSGNTTCDVQNTLAQFAICAQLVTGATVERMHFDVCCGVNTVVLAGSRLAVRDCWFTFELAASTLSGGEYDNSACYLVGPDQHVTGNTFRAALAQHARGAIEVHHGPGEVTGNITEGYDTLVNVVTQTSELPALAATNVTVTGNTVVDGGHAIRLWSATGYTLGGVVVSGNTIALNNADRGGTTTYVGINVENGTGLDGTVEDVIIAHNRITLQPENRAGYSFADSGGILAYARGLLRNITIQGNTITGSPTQGIRVHSTTATASNIQVLDNTVIDAGNNTSATAGYRVGIILADTVDRGSRVEGNILIDTGASLLGYGGITCPGGASWLYVRHNVQRITALTGSFVNSYSAYAQHEVLVAYDIGGDFNLLGGRYEHYEFTLDGLSPAFAITASQFYTYGQRVTLTIINASGGGGPAITWTDFLMASWTNPSNGYRRTVEFAWNGTKLREMARSNDTPNS